MVSSSLVKPETSCTVMLSPMVSVLWLDHHKTSFCYPSSHEYSREVVHSSLCYSIIGMCYGLIILGLVGGVSTDHLLLATSWILNLKYHQRIRNQINASFYLPLQEYTQNPACFANRKTRNQLDFENRIALKYSKFKSPMETFPWKLFSISESGKGQKVRFKKILENSSSFCEKIDDGDPLGLPFKISEE